MDPLPPPFVAVAGLANVRDIGGWPVLDGTGAAAGAVRRGLVYRGPDPSTATAAGLATLRELGVGVFVDLRSAPQVARAGGTSGTPPPGFRRVWAPVFADALYTPARAAARYRMYASDGVDGIVQAFAEILTQGAPAFARVLRLLAATPPAALVHCTTGNNRSGAFVAVLLALLGVPPRAVAAEYALSQAGLAAARPAAVARLVQNPVFEGQRARVERMLGAREESMLAMLELVRERWGGAEGYVRRCCGLAADEVEAVRRVLVASEPPSFGEVFTEIAEEGTCLAPDDSPVAKQTLESTQ